MVRERGKHAAQLNSGVDDEDTCLLPHTVLHVHATYPLSTSFPLSLPPSLAVSPRLCAQYSDLVNSPLFVFLTKRCATLGEQLYRAAGSGDIEGVKTVMRKNKRKYGIVNWHHADTKQSVLHLAAHNGFGEIVSLLINNGADVNAFTKEQKTPLYGFQGKRTPIHLATANKHGDVVSRLIQSGANVNAQDFLGRTALHYAALEGDNKIINMLIVRAGAQVSIADKVRDGP